MRYNPRSLPSAINAARHLAKERGGTVYVVATARGYRLSREAPVLQTCIATDGNRVWTVDPVAVAMTR